MRVTGNLKSVLRQISNADLIVTPRLTDWLVKHPNGLTVDDEVGDVIKQLITRTPRNRTRSFSSSASGQCPRKQVFDYLGMPALDDVNAQLELIFMNGTWMHLRYQALFLTMGVLDAVEIPLHWPAMRSMGTMDGSGTVPMDHPRVAWRGLEFGMEIKSANQWVFNQLQKDGPGKYLQQVHRYFLSGGYDLFVIFIENKNTQEWLEFVVEPDPDLITEQQEELRLLNDAVDNKTLPPLLPQCQAIPSAQCAYGTNVGSCNQLRRQQWPTVT